MLKDIFKALTGTLHDDCPEHLGLGFEVEACSQTSKLR